MATMQAAAPGDNGDEPKRGRSTIEFPYFALDEAITMAQAVHAVGGTSCTVEQLAGQMRQAPNGGGFRIRLQAARTFGVITYERGNVDLTDLGIHIIDSKFQRAARVESFLSVPLFKAAYDKLKSGVLPPAAAIERTLEGLGVAPKQKDKARHVFIKSAKQAGFFDIDSERLVIPNLNAAGALPVRDEAAPVTAPARSSRAEVPELGIHVAIQGLLRELPEPGTVWPAQKKERFLQAFKSTIDFIYPEEQL
jgi:hypothetical protein